jgi:hypothetical protein
MRAPLLISWYLIAFALYPVGCRSLPCKDEAAKALFLQGRFQKAAELIPAYRPVSGRDRIIYLVDRGIILHTAGRYRQSNPYLLRAAKLLRYYDVIRWWEEGGKILTNENFADYRGEDYERVLVHTYLALNYCMLGLWEDALVECKWIDITLYRIAKARGIDYRQNLFSLLLSAMVYEELGELNEAYIDYKKMHKVDPGNPLAREGLLRCSKLLGFDDDYKRWRDKFGEAIIHDPSRYGELIIIYQSGRVPRKVPHPVLRIIPAYPPSSTPYSIAKILVTDQAGNTFTAQTIPVNEIERTMRLDLEERALPLLAKRALILAAKVGVAEEIKRQTTGPWGDIAKALAFYSERPDLRGIYTLPARISVARIPLRGGLYNVKLIPMGIKIPEGTCFTWSALRVLPGRKALLNVRSMQ